MNQSLTPIYKTGWLYLFIIGLFAFAWGIDQGILKSANQWNRDFWHSFGDQPNDSKQVLYVKLTESELEQKSWIAGLFKKYPAANYGLIFKSDLSIEKSIKAYLSKSKTPASVVLATSDRFSGTGFNSEDGKNLNFFQNAQSIYELTEITEKDAGELLLRPSVVERNGSIPMIWKYQDQVYPGFITTLWSAYHNDVAALDREGMITHSIKIKDDSYPLGMTGRIFAFADSVNSISLKDALSSKRYKPKLIVIHDETVEPDDIALASIGQLAESDYIYQGGITFYASYLLMIAALVFNWWLIHATRGKKIAMHLSFATGLILLQYLAFYFSQWLPILHVIILSVFGALIVAGYELENHKVARLQKNHNKLIAKAADLFFDNHQFDSIQPFLNETSPDKHLLNKIYTIALKAEDKKNMVLAEKLLVWIKDTGITHRKTDKKLAEYNKPLSDSMLEATMLISPEQMMGSTPSNLGIQFKSFGRYKVEGVLGQGAMGVVFKGVDPKINRHVAIKTLQLKSDTENMEDIKARFFREAETAGNLSHANIVTIYDVGEEGSLGYIAMDFLSGVPLSDCVKGKTRLTPTVVYQLMVQLADALEYAHSQNIVHRDIKPANVMYDKKMNRVTLTDFGIAHISDKSKTKTGTVMGSPYYMSPEQVIGKKVDGRSDVFSLGVTFYQLLSGNLPFEGESIASVAFHITKTQHKPVKHWNKKLPASAVRITNKALQKDIDKRFQSMKEFKQALVAALKKDFRKEVTL